MAASKLGMTVDRMHSIIYNYVQTRLEPCFPFFPNRPLLSIEKVLPSWPCRYWMLSPEWVSEWVVSMTLTLLIFHHTLPLVFGRQRHHRLPRVPDVDDEVDEEYGGNGGRAAGVLPGVRQGRQRLRLGLRAQARHQINFFIFFLFFTLCCPNGWLE